MFAVKSTYESNRKASVTFLIVPKILSDFIRGTDLVILCIFAFRCEKIRGKKRAAGRSPAAGTAGVSMFVIFIRSAIVYALVILAIRIMGKRQVGDMQPGELVITFLISEAAATPLENADQPILTGVVAIFSLVIMEVLTSVLTMKFFPARKIINGRSAILIANGEIDQKSMKDLRVTVPDLLELLREQGIFNINEVSYAVLETDGQLSVLSKCRYQPLSAQLQETPDQGDQMPFLIISDGNLLSDGLRHSGLDEERLTALLKQKDLRKKDVFLMTADAAGQYYIVEKQHWHKGGKVK